MTVILVDPSRFTAPYDAALSQGLQASGLDVVWATRPLREKEIEQLPSSSVREIFYRRFDRPNFLPPFLRGPAKGLSHILGLLRLLRLAQKEKADTIHFQWAVLPIIDALAMCLTSRRVVLTVHDTVPFNGEKISFFQNLGFDLPIRAADAVIVHTPSAARTLVERGHLREKIHVVPHGALTLEVPVPATDPAPAGGLWTFTLFGQIKPYKGLDVLVAAVAASQDRLRSKARIVVAGASHMDIEPIRASIKAAHIEDLIDLRIGRLSEEEVALLFAETNCFLFPYRQIDASGVYYLTAPLGKWLIASNVGVFAENLVPNQNGDLVKPGDSAALGDAMVKAAHSRPIAALGNSIPSWETIGRTTKSIYDKQTRERK